MATVNTTWVSPAGATLDKSTGGTIDETMTDAWSSDLYNLGGTVGHIGARVSNNANQSLPNATITAITFNTEDYDTDPNGAIHDTSSNTSRLTCQTAGRYQITGTVSFASNATGFRLLSIRLNGTTDYAQSTVMALTGNATVLQITTVINLAATNYVELMAYQTSTGALNSETVGVIAPTFIMAKV